MCKHANNCIFGKINKKKKILFLGRHFRFSEHVNILLGYLQLVPYLVQLRLSFSMIIGKINSMIFVNNLYKLIDKTVVVLQT